MTIAATMRGRKRKAVRREKKERVPVTTTMPETTRMATPIWRAATKKAIIRCGFISRVVSFCCINIEDSKTHKTE